MRSPNPYTVFSLPSSAEILQLPDCRVAAASKCGCILVLSLLQVPSTGSGAGYAAERRKTIKDERRKLCRARAFWISSQKHDACFCHEYE